MAVDIFADNLPNEEFEAGRDPEAEVVFRPIDDGTYPADLIFSESDSKARWNGTNSTPVHYWARLQAVFPSGKRAFKMVSTRPFAVSNGSEATISEADRVLKALGEGERAKDASSPLKLAQQVDTVISAGVKANVRTQWEAECRSCREAGRRHSKASPTKVFGQKNFPLAADGTYNPIAKCPTCGEEMGAASASFRVVSRA